jgi:hypothetical protein
MILLSSITDFKGWESEKEVELYHAKSQQLAKELVPSRLERVVDLSFLLQKPGPRSLLPYRV